MEKIDPKLWQLIDAYAAGELPPDPENPDFLVHVYVAVENDDFGGLTAAGYEVSSELGGTAAVTIPIPEIETLADRADVLAIFAAKSGEPMDDPSMAYTTEQYTLHLIEAYGITSHNRPGGSHGEDVLVGIVDSGVNILHDAFTFETIESGKKVRKTRILAYWAQGATTKKGTTKIWERNGKVFSESDLNALIAAFASSGTLPPATVLDLENDVSGHGTAVASVAAGAQWPAGPDVLGIRTGIAPAARLVVVSGQKDAIAGIEFCFEKAEEASQPCVVNMSLGTHDEPHNGMSVFSHRLRALLTQGSPATFRPARAFVTAAGNEGINHNHGHLSVAQPKTLEIVVDPKEIELGCLISSSKAGLKVSLAPPAARPTFSPAGPFRGKKIVRGHEVSISELPAVSRQGPDGLPADTDTHIIVNSLRNITATSGIFVRPGTWQLKLDPDGSTHPNVHVWWASGTVLDSQKLDDPDFEFGWAEEDGASGSERRWWRPKEWIEATLRSEPTGRDPITVGGTIWSTDFQTVSPLRISSRGPTTDAGRSASDTKPDLVAPGDNILVAQWKKPRRSSDKPSRSTRKDGTSFASPAVAGAVALMLSHDPTLNQIDIRTILRTTTSPWSALVQQKAFAQRQIDEQNIAGKGLLNIEAALKAVKARIGP